MALDFIATTGFGLEAVVRRELADLGYEGRVVAPGWIGFGGELSAICRANLWLRAADRVLVQVATFPAADFDALFETTRALPWQDWLPADAQFPVSGRSIKSQLTSVPACQRSVKKAIVESLQRGYGTSELPETGPLYRIEVALLDNRATLTIDTTGPGLHKRAYRQADVRAPLKETLAAAMVLLSFWNPERPLIDPFCGSGVIPIEAAWIGRHMAPGLMRSFAAESWPIFAAEWNEARSEARDVARPVFSERLVGTDSDERLLALARRNAVAAGIDDQVHFQCKPFENLSSKREFGCIVTSLPDERANGRWHEVESLYRQVPVVLRRLPTWSHFILTGYPRFEGLLQKSADRRRKLYNGRLECTYYQFHGPPPSIRDNVTTEPTSDREGPAEEQDSASTSEVKQSPAPRPPLRPVFGGLSAKAHEQASLFRSRLEKLARHLRRWPTRQGITCFRLYERDIPEIPLVVDRYEDHVHITEYERPHERDVAEHADWLELMARTAAEALQVDRPHVFLKQRERQRGAAQHEHLSEEHYEITVQEGGLKFLVNLSDYVDTGLFLDHRITRSLVRDLSAGARFLNLFAYTGAFSVYAAAGGAAQTTTVDWSRTYLEWAERNMQLNGFRGAQHRFVRADALEFLRQLAPGPQFDLAVIDPPTFSNSKRTEEIWDVQRDHVEALNLLLQRMRTGGAVFFSTNFRRFKLEEEAIAAAAIHEISRQTVPPDFRNRRIHRCWKITAR
jgi:23S rRNA (guanine2445-N2)-methyltransferase / 23S rRNA (guanine2069-N7)-methyltransferase